MSQFDPRTASGIRVLRIMRIIRRGHYNRRGCRATGEIRLVNRLFGLAVPRPVRFLATR